MMLEDLRTNKQLTVLSKIAQRIWNAISKEGINQLKVQEATKVYLESLKNKRLMLRSGQVEVSKDELRREPKQVASELLDVLKKLDKPKP